MKLFLTASTITPNLLKPFEELIGRPSKNLKAAFIPDAGLHHDGDTSWIDKEMNDISKHLQWRVDKITLGDENRESLRKLFQYNVIFVNGGNSSYLAQVMRKSGFADLLPQFLSSGVTYVGSSAGSMVLSKVQDAAKIYFGEPEPEALEVGGLGLVDFEFYPIHKHRWTPDLVEKITAARNPALKYYLVKDGQALSLKKGVLRTHGDVMILEAQT